jgi:hypothetical protein
VQPDPTNTNHKGNNMIKPANKRPFSLGRLVATPAALELLEKHGKTPHEFIRRHQSGDWGDLCDEDAELNDVSIEDGSRILSSYKLGDQKLWVISEAADDHGNRYSTTILLSSEY